MIRSSKCSPLYFLFVLLLLVQAPALAQSPASITGGITDSEDGKSLFGASVLLSLADGTVIQGVAADADGQFQITDIEPGDYQLEVRYISYVGFKLNVSLAAGEVRTVNAVLEPESINISTIVVTASRGAELVLDAPASISVIDTEEIQRTVSYSTVSALRNTTGVDLVQTSIDRTQIALRGFNAANVGSVYVLSDYRQPAAAGGMVLYSSLPSITIDTDRIEVVRGPASALYGAGGDEGVIHFISKSPFDYPGTTFSVTGGERSTFSGQYRHAGVVNNRVGYKFTAMYTQADDWEFDPDEPMDAFQLSRDAIARDYQYSKLTANGMLQYRFGETGAVTANAGYSELNGNLLTGLATIRANEMASSYAQLRVTTGSFFFAQAYGTWNNAGSESYFYNTGRNVIQSGPRYAAQVQFDLQSNNDRNRFIIGADLDHTAPDTEGTISGRFEDEDQLTQIGGYAQSSLSLNEKVNFTFAVRGDWSNVFEELELSPRAALVFKPTPRQTFRATFNQAFAMPRATQLYLDIPGQVQPLGLDRRMMLMGLGGHEPFTFNNFEASNEARFFLPVNGFFGEDFAVNAMPLTPVLGAAAGGGVIDLLRSTEPLPIPGLSEQQRGLLADLLGYALVSGSLNGATTSSGELGFPSQTAEGGYRPVSGPVEKQPLERVSTRSFELGYKGLIGNKALLNIDVYQTNKKNFIGSLALITPFVYLQQEGLTQDVAAELSNIFDTSADPAMQGLVAGLEASGLPRQQIAQLLSGLIGGAMGDRSVALVQSDRDALAPGTENAVGGILTFDNFGDVNYWGTDISLEVYPTRNLTVFSTFSYISDDLFDHEELKEVNPIFEQALNASRIKVRVGGDYSLQSGLSIFLSSQYNHGYPVRSGQLVGDVDSAILFDIGLGYDLDQYMPGLRFDLMVQNVMNDRYRQFIAPQRWAGLAWRALRMILNKC